MGVDREPPSCWWLSWTSYQGFLSWTSISYFTGRRGSTALKLLEIHDFRIDTGQKHSSRNVWCKWFHGYTGQIKRLHLDTLLPSSLFTTSIMLTVPGMSCSHHRAFALAIPYAWNALPPHPILITTFTDALPPSCLCSKATFSVRFSQVI